MDNPLDAYLRGLRADAAELSVALSKVNLEGPGPERQWPALLSQFLLITSKLSSITQDLIGSGIERELASGFVFVPTVDNFDPAQLIRVKPITEVEDQAQARLAEFDRDDDMERDDITLSDRLQEFASSCSEVVESILKVPAAKSTGSTGSASVSVVSNDESVRALVSAYQRGESLR
ncbi:Mediator of RNA polymerase II transcription subunit 8 [Plasmodiophora brassicae]|uniref:Uncharacterized protein n=1 Tax=Plasmodiophora brassicae TaxID=37360 RepID=A0A0G4IR87_PLABS|nr:hypothetical protein PBRA_006018 [Plasmodiophora brassicae]SPQ98120.1 unnamed protein product [Plasmodiophora brassicae]